MWEKFCTVEELYQRENDLKKDDVLALQEWVNKQSHLPAIDEFLLICFLHACYYKMEATKVCIENFCTMRAHWPEFSQNRDVFSKENQETLRATLVTPLPARTNKNNYTILYTRLMDTSVDNFDMLAQIRLCDVIAWLLCLIMGTQPGQVMVMDMEGVSLGHLMKVNLVYAKKHIHYIQEALPVRLKAIHMINVTPLTDKLLAMLKPFMKKELMNLIFTHSKIDSLFEYLPKEGLPKEYGGEAGSFKELHEKQIRILEKHARVILDTEEMISDESKRQGKPKNASDVFGIEGTFRKLDID